MRVLVFGGTGSVGRLVVEGALSLGHDVTAFVREPSRLEDIADERLTVVRGDVLKAESVEEVVPGYGAVICCLGAGAKGTVRSEGTRNIVRAMERAGVRRFVCQSTLGAGDSRGNLNFYWKRIMFGLLLRKAYRDHQEQEGHVMRSRLDWTIVRPAAFTDGERTGSYRHVLSPKERDITFEISRADVADFVLKQLDDDTYLRRTPGISY